MNFDKRNKLREKYSCGFLEGCPGRFGRVEIKNIAQLVGENTQRIRKEHGITLSDLALVGRKNGAKWSIGRLGDIESGRSSSISLQTVLLLAVCLSEATGKIYAPIHLLQTAVPIEISEQWTLTPESFNTLVSRGVPYIAVGDIHNGSDQLDKSFQSFQEKWKLAGKGVPGKAVSEGANAYSLADSRAAAKLGVGEFEFIGACWRLWGHLLSVETEVRAPEGATPQKKGRITRELLKQLRGQIRVDQDKASENEYVVVQGELPKIEGHDYRGDPEGYKYRRYVGG